jgi:hypothetical protein
MLLSIVAGIDTSVKLDLFTVRKTGGNFALRYELLAIAYYYMGNPSPLIILVWFVTPYSAPEYHSLDSAAQQQDHYPLSL